MLETEILFTDEAGIGEDRKWTPCVKKETWNEIALRSGFTASILTLDDYADTWCQEISIMVFSAVDSTKEAPSRLPNVELIRMPGPSEGYPKDDLEHDLQVALSSRGCQTCEVITLLSTLDLPQPSGDNWLVILDVHGSVLRSLDQEILKGIQAMLASRTKILWVISPASEQERATTGILDGLARVLRTENPQLVLVTLAFETVSRSQRCVTDKIIQILSATDPRLSKGTLELEYVEKGKFLSIGRLIRAFDLERHIMKQTSATQTVVQNLNDTPSMKMSIRTPGLLDSLAFEQDLDTIQPLMNGEIEVEVNAVGLNFTDVLVALGKLGSRSFIGCECAGVVCRTGEQCEFQVGDRVAMLQLGTFKTRARCSHQCAVRIPDDIPFSAAASMLVTFSTAYLALHELARLRDGETVLIHSAAGGVGQSAVQIAKLIGAEIYAIVGSDDKKWLLMELYDIAEDHIFSSRNTTFARGIKRMTQGRGVDVVLNSLSGEELFASWECVAPYGRFVEIGKKDILLGNKLSMLPFEKNATFCALDIAAVVRDIPPYLKTTLEYVMNLLVTGKIQPPQPLQIYSLQQTEQAFRHLQQGKSTGKIVVIMEKADLVTVSGSSWLSLRLTKNDVDGP